MKRLFIAIGIFVLCLAFSISAVPNVDASTSSPTVMLDGNLLSFDIPPIIENGRTLVPLRAIFEALGAEVIWDATTQTVTAEKGNTKITLNIGGAAYKNGQFVQLEVPAKIVAGRTLVPLRFVSEALGCDVGWNGLTQVINIESKPMDLIVTDETFFAPKGSSGEVRVMATIENPNDKFIPYRINYSFSGYDAQGNLVDITGEGMPGAPISTIYVIPPKEKVTIFNHLYDKSGKIAKVKINIPAFEWTKFSGVIPAMTVSNSNLQVKDSYIKVVGEVTNQSPDFTTSAWVLISLLDSNGKTVDGDFTMVKDIGPKQTLPFSTTLWDKWGSTRMSIVAYPCSIKGL